MNQQQRYQLAQQIRDARLIRRAGDLRRSLDMLCYVIDHRPECRGAYRLIAHLALQIDQPDIARHYAATALLIWPDDAGAAGLLARVALLSGDSDDAVTLAQEAWGTAPHRLSIAKVLAEAYATVGKTKKALAFLESIRSRCPHKASIHIQIAELSLIAKQPEIGLRAIRALVHPPLLLQTRLLMMSQRLPEAIDCCDLLLKRRSLTGVDDHRVRAKSQLARIDCLESLGDLNRLRAMALHELHDDLDDPAEVHIRLAEALLSMGHTEMCVKLAFRHRHDGTMQARVWSLLAAAADTEGRHRLAGRCAKRIADLSHEDSASVAQTFRRGLIADVIKDQGSCRRAGADPNPSVLKPILERTIAVLDRKLLKHPDYADYRYHRANCHDGLGNTNAAEADLQRALLLNPAYDAAQRLLNDILQSEESRAA